MSVAETAPDITSPCSMALPEHELMIIAGPRDITFFPTGSTQRGLTHVEPLRQYVMYRSFLDYNVESIASPPESLPGHVDPLRFTVQRLVPHETPVEGGVAVHHAEVAETIDLFSTDMRRFLIALDRPLTFAVGFYLRVEHPRYILAEYYKSFESIAEALGGVGPMTKALRRYGITESERREFTRLCNDQHQNPTDLGRHAAKPGTELRVIDIRNPFADVRFVRNFESTTQFCRKVIDAYVMHRVHSLGGS